MNTLFVCREKFGKIYKEYEFYFKLAGKFIFALLTLNMLTKQLGYYEVLNILPIRLFLAVVCAFVPVPIVVLIVALVALLHLFKLSIVLAALALVVFLIVYFLYLRFAPAQGIFMLAIAVLAPFHLHYAVALILGLFFTPMTIVPVGLSFVLMTFISYLKEAGPMIGTEFEIDSILKAYQFIVDGMMSNKEMLLYIGAFAIVIALTYVIAKMPFDYSWYIAIAVGGIANLVILILGAGLLHVDTGMGGVIIGTLAGMAIAAVLQFFKCTISYSRKEFVQFEDDDYYYYVRAIPKISVSGEDIQYKMIDDENEAEELNDKKAAMMKRAAKKASKAPKTEEKKVSDETKTAQKPLREEEDWDDDVIGKTAQRASGKRSRQASAQGKSQNTTGDFGAYDDINFDNYDDYIDYDDESKF